MTAQAPRVATWLLVRFSSGPHGEAIAGDLLEQYASATFAVVVLAPGAVGDSRRHLHHGPGQQVANRAAIALGWVAYVATSFPATWLVRRSRLITQQWLSDIDPEWFFWTLRAESTLIIAMVCVAIGWGVAKASRRSAPGAVCLLAMTVLIFEYGMIAFFFAELPGPARPLVDGRTRQLLLCWCCRGRAGILLGGLIGMRPGIEQASAVTRLGSS